MSVETVRVRRQDVRRQDTCRVIDLPVSDLLWWIKAGKASAAYGVMRRKPLRGDVPYMQKAPGSRWCIRVDFVQAGATPLDPPEPIDPLPPPSRLTLAFRAALRGLPLALLLLAGLDLAGAFQSPQRAPGAYKRPDWSDVEGCLNTREVAILGQCRPVALSEDGCRILWAVCVDRYTGAEIVTDAPSQGLHADHLYPASEAWKRRRWTAREFDRFFNDLNNIVIVRARTNLRKGDRMPHQWCPSDPKARPWAAEKLRAAAQRWKLPIKPAEEVGLQAWERGECAPGARAIGGDR